MRLSPVSSMAELQTHGVRPEQARFHDLEIGRNVQRYAGLGQHMLFEIDARSDLGDEKTFRCKLENAALGDVSNVLALRHRPAAGEGDLLHLGHDLLDLAFLVDPELAL